MRSVLKCRAAQGDKPGAAGERQIMRLEAYTPYFTPFLTSCQAPNPAHQTAVFNHDLSHDLDLALAGREQAPNVESRRFWGETLSWLERKVPGGEEAQR